MAAASIINVMIGLVRIKVVALVLGPAGVGLLGLLNNLVATASNLSALGMGSSGTRQVAEAVGRNDTDALALARLALRWGLLLAACAGAVTFWLLRDLIAVKVLGTPDSAGRIAWLALAVGLTVAGVAQGTLLNGMRRIGELARLTICAAAVSTVTGIASIILWKQNGLIVYLLVAPLTTLLLGHYYVARLPHAEVKRYKVAEIAREYRKMVSLGMAFMLAGLVATLSQLAVRSILQRRLGLDALGLFEAAWVISMTYVGFVLSAMGTDYFPRLSEVVQDHPAVRKLVNEQTEVALLIAGPIFLAMLGLAPWVLQLLYSSSFTGAAETLRWQIMGDMLKVVSWPLGFVLLARGDGRTFLLCECIAYSVFILLTLIGVTKLGILAVGVAVLGMYATYLPLVYWLARRRLAFRWSARVFSHGIALIGSGFLLIATSVFSSGWAVAVGCLMATAAGSYGLWRLIYLEAIPKPFSAIASRMFGKQDASKI